MPAGRPDGRWNHNIHYHSVVLEAIPRGARTALDVGTGDGLLAVDLADAGLVVTALDIDDDVLARARPTDTRVTWIAGDFRTYPVEPRQYDVVASIATLHHLPDPGEALERLAALTSPGGVLAVIGLGRSHGLVDRAYAVLGTLQHQVYRRRRTEWEHSAPVVWPPPHTYAEVRRAAMTALPGVEWRRLPMWRYALLWRRPRHAP